MGRLSNSDERRMEIVQALLRVISRRGYAAASIQEVAKEAGLAPGLIHYHFENKQEILLTLFAHLEAIVAARMQVRLEPQEKVDARDRLDAMIDAFLALDSRSDQRAVLCWTMLCAEAIHNAELRRLFGQAMAGFQAQLDSILADAFRGRRGRTKVKESSAAILSAIHGSFLLGCATPDVIPKGAAAANVKRMAHGLLSALDGAA